MKIRIHIITNVFSLINKKIIKLLLISISIRFCSVWHFVYISYTIRASSRENLSSLWSEWMNPILLLPKAEGSQWNPSDT